MLRLEKNLDGTQCLEISIRPCQLITTVLEGGKTVIFGVNSLRIVSHFSGLSVTFRNVVMVIFFLKIFQYNFCTHFSSRLNDLQERKNLNLSAIGAQIFGQPYHIKVNLSTKVS